MTDKIKLKADKFVNDKKLKLNYIKPKDLKILLAEFCEEQIAELSKHIVELQKDKGELIDKAAELQHKVDTLQGFLDHDIEYDMDKTIQELRKENAELRNNGFTVSAMTEQQLKVALEKGEQLEKENVELKADNDARKFAMAMSEKVEKQLRNERNTFLAQNEQYEKDLIDFNEQLIKAKEILKSLYFIIESRIDYKNNIGIADEMWRAEQFWQGE